MLIPESCIVLLLAVAIDCTFGEPPNAWHPVAWMGNCISASRRCVLPGRWQPFLLGLAISVVGILVMALAGFCLVVLLRRLPLPLSVLCQAIILKMTFSIRGLIAAGTAVETALGSGDLALARRLIAWHLVSRDTSGLNDPQLCAATIESLAENTSDSIVAPLLFYAMAGLPGALAYRYINTCDAMLGYRDAEREWLGKAPARIDDVANFLPARVTALVMLAASALLGARFGLAITIWRRDRRATSSPNAGHPMSAASGALAIQLEKVGVYKLGQGLRAPAVGDIARTMRLLLATTGLALLLLCAMLTIMEHAL